MKTLGQNYFQQPDSRPQTFNRQIQTFSEIILYCLLSIYPIHCLLPARDIKIVRPIYGVELFDGETARFEVEISEDDVRGQWKLNGEVLSPSSVSLSVAAVLLQFLSLCSGSEHVSGVMSQDVDIIEEGGKHTLILYNCRVAMTGEVAYAAANAKCSANLKVKGRKQLPAPR